MIDFLYDLFYMVPVGIALILSIAGLGLGNNVFVSANGTTMSPAIGCIVSSLFIIIVLVLRYSEKKQRILISGILVVSVTSFLGIVGKDKRAVLYDKYSMVFVILAISFVAIIIGRTTEKLIQAKIVVSVILLACVIYMMVNKMPCPRGTLGFCVFNILIYLLEIIQRYWNKSGYTDIKNHVARLAPVIMVMTIIVMIIPAPSNRFEWKMAKNFWKAAVTEYKRIVGSITVGKEEYAYTGFSEDGGVNVGLLDNGREVMIVSSDKKTFDTLYMGGMTYEDFDGQKWSTKLDSEPGDREFDYVETIVAINKFGQGFERDYIKTDNIKIENRLFHTKYIFAPIKTNLDSRKTAFPKHKEMESKIISDKKMKYSDSYNIDYLQMNFDNPDLILLADTAQPFNEDEWSSILRKNQLDDADISYEKYLEYKDDVYEKYGGNQRLTMEEALEVAQLSDDIKLIVKDIIAGDEKGDFEKLKALSDYLQTMQYTKSTEALPKEIDNADSYLDYFMLKSKRGYCVHFATAFTLLARQLGFPARYVQGYYVECDGIDTLVTENRAHAWTEVYFDNFGWVIFEATPGYSISGGWSVSGNKVNQNSIYQNQPVINNVSSNAKMDELPQEEEKNYRYILYVAIPLLCAVLFGVIFLLISRIIAWRKYRMMNAEDKVRTMISRNMRILKIFGYIFEENETLNEYRIKIEENDELTEPLKFFSLYEALLYSHYEVRADDVEAVENDYLLLKNALKAKGFKYRFYIV